MVILEKGETDFIGKNFSGWLVTSRNEYEEKVPMY